MRMHLTLSRSVQISIDLFCMAQQYVDVATLAILTQMTCGQLYLYQPFNEVTHGDEFLNDLKWNILRPQVSLCIKQFEPQC